MWPDEWLWKKLSGDSGNSGEVDTYQRVEETYRNRQQYPSESAYDEWKEAVEAYTDENERLFGQADTCADLADNVTGWLQDRNYEVEIPYGKGGNEIEGYLIVGNRQHLYCRGLDDVLAFARGIAKAEGLL